MLRRRPLLVHIVPLAVAEGLVDGGHITGIYGINIGQAQALFVQGINQHSVGLKEVVHQHRLAAQLVPDKILIRFAPGQEKTVPFIDLGEVHEIDRFPLLQVGKTGGHRRLGQVGLATAQGVHHRAFGGLYRIVGFEPLGLEKAAVDADQEGGIKRRVAQGHDIDGGHVDMALGEFVS